MGSGPRIDRLDKNRIINGFLEYWQRGASFTAPSSNQYSADRFHTALSGTMVFNVLRSTDVPGVSAEDVAPTYSLHVDVTTAQASINPTDFMYVRHHIEYGFMRDLIGKPITISFYVKSPKTGIHYCVLRNGNNTHTKTIQYTVSVANTWQKIVVNTTLENSITYGSGVGVGLQLIWPLAAGSSVVTGSNDTWVVGAFSSGTGQQNLVDNVANNFMVAMVELCGGTFNSSKPFSLAGRNLPEELQLCQRYYEKSYNVDVAPTSVDITGAEVMSITANIVNLGSLMKVPYKTRKRANAVIQPYSVNGVVNRLTDGNLSDLANGTVTSGSTYETGARVSNQSGATITPPAFNTGYFHWVADAEL